MIRMFKSMSALPIAVLVSGALAGCTPSAAEVAPLSAEQSAVTCGTSLDISSSLLVTESATLSNFGLKTVRAAVRWRSSGPV